MSIKTLKEILIEQIIEDGFGWYTIFSKINNVPSDIKDEIHDILVKRLEYVLRCKIPVQKKVMAAQAVMKSMGNQVFVNVHDIQKPSSVVFNNRYIVIAGVCYNPNTLTTMLISYERWLLRCQSPRCRKSIAGGLVGVFTESANRCNTCALVYCEKCIFSRNEHGIFDCKSHS